MNLRTDKKQDFKEPETQNLNTIIPNNLLDLNKEEEKEISEDVKFYLIFNKKIKNSNATLEIDSKSRHKLRNAVK